MRTIPRVAGSSETPFLRPWRRGATAAPRRAHGWARRRDGAGEELREIVRRIVEAVQPKKILLFGSAARGGMGAGSDLDLLVVKDGVHRRKTAQRIEHALIGTRRATDIVVATSQDLRRHRHTLGLIYRPALREGRTVYAS